MLHTISPACDLIGRGKNDFSSQTAIAAGGTQRGSGETGLPHLPEQQAGIEMALVLDETRDFRIDPRDLIRAGLEAIGQVEAAPE